MTRDQQHYEQRMAQVLAQFEGRPFTASQRARIATLLAHSPVRRPAQRSASTRDSKS